MTSVARLPRLLERFETVERPSEPSALAVRRRDAREAFAEAGMPTGREESWRATPVRSLRDGDFGPAPRRDVEIPAEWLGLSSAPLVFVDGRRVLGGEDPAAVAAAWSVLHAAGVDATPLGPRRDGAGALSEANAALFEDAAVVRIPEGVRIEHPIVVVNLTSAPADAAVFPRTRIELGERAEATVVEVFAGLGEGLGWTNAVTEIEAADASLLRYVRLQDLPTDASITGSLLSRQGRDSRVETLNLDFGAALGRLESLAVLDGTGAWCRLDGLVLADGTQHLDNQTVLDHARPHGDSREVYKSILGGKARTVFNGRIVVREDAQKTDAKQSNPNLLLSDEALARTRPQLEIYADDVRCTHGATVGRLDENAEFYLRTRGIPRARAKRLLVRAFASEVLGALPSGPVENAVLRRVDSELDALAGGE